MGAEHARIDRSAALLGLTKQHEMSMSLDDAIEKITLALGDRAADTMFIYLSDNGYMHGSHRLDGKNVPYEWSTDVPMAIKWPGYGGGRQLTSRHERRPHSDDR